MTGGYTIFVGKGSMPHTRAGSLIDAYCAVRAAMAGRPGESITAEDAAGIEQIRATAAGKIWVR